MFRYRCPHCRQVLQSLEMRAGKTTICPKCSRALTIPADKSEWLNERGEPLLASPTVLIPSGPPEVRASADEPDDDDSDADVLGAIGVGAPSAVTPLSVKLPPDTLTPSAAAPTPPPAPAFYRSIPRDPPQTPAPANGAAAEPKATAPAATLTPPPRTPASVASHDHVTVTNPPIRLRTQMDIVTELTTALTSRLNPRPRPLRDLRPVTALGLPAAGIAIILLLTQFTSNNRPWAGAIDHSPPAPTTDIAAQPDLVRLRHYRDHRDFHSLTNLLRTLAHTDPTAAESAKDRAEIAAELQALCAHPDVAVKAEALAAYALWGGTDARTLCLTAVRSTDQDERIMALKLLAKWKDPEVARAVAGRVSRPGEPETEVAIRALEEIGQPAERAVFQLLRSRDQSTRLAAIELLGGENVGGPDSVAELRALAGLPDAAGNPPPAGRASDDPHTRAKAAAKAQAIQELLLKK